MQDTCPSQDRSGRSVSAVQRDFSRWRRGRAPGTRIPAALWDAAIELATEVGISPASRALGLDYYALKKRVEGAPAPTPSFVELTLPALTPDGECHLELEQRDGTRLRVELRGAAVAQAEAVARALRAGAP